MKKFVILLSFLFLFVGCNKQTQEDTLAGTIWVTNLNNAGEELLAIEFLSETGVKTYRTDSDLRIFENTVMRGTYTKSGDSVTFSLKYWTLTYNADVLSGAISGDRMSVKTKYHNRLLDKDIEETYSFVRKK